ncbi:hypothetical protein SAMN06295970_1043 [Noviherbaspirillum suwonense]|uniref:Uncharacterized protein n=1 Tax=Noviherbaspirillum suwonense TaxID=1224511 RepID=A0ABY1Q0S1_9BURK|nr:hypothetical protein SAMN06295970_1043 [Noviherbaspirillum suwonense]
MTYNSRVFFQRFGMKFASAVTADLHIIDSDCIECNLFLGSLFYF